MQRRQFIGAPLAFTAAAAAAAVPSVGRAASPVPADDYVTFEDYGAVGDGAADDTAAIQAAINDNPGRQIWATRRNYRLTAALRILHPVELCAAQGGTQLLMDVADRDHIVIGDGTEAGMMASLNVVIDGFTFIPGANAGVSATGSCIFFNFASFFDIRNCDFYGRYGNQSRSFRGLTLFRASDGFIRHCRLRFFRDDGVHTQGSPHSSNPNPYRTVDVRMESLRVYSCGGHQVYFGPHTGGMFVNDAILLQAGQKPAFYIDSDPVTEDGTNFFIVNVNIEGGEAGSRGIVVNKGQSVQIVGGWVGGIAGNGAAVELGAGASSCEINGLKADFCGLIVSGPANSIKNCEISGDLSATVNGIALAASASDTLISGCRIRQFTGSAIAIAKQNGVGPARCVIEGLTLKDSPAAPYIDGADYREGPVVEAIRSDAAAYLGAAAVLPLNYGAPFYQVTGGTPIQDISPRNPGRRVVIQAGMNGLSFVGNGALQLKGGAANVAVPAFRTIEFFCDGVTWFESGGSR